MAYAHIVSTAKAAATSDAVDSTGGDLAVMGIGDGGGAVADGCFSDSKGNTYTERTAYTFGSGVRLAYCQAPTVGSGHTFSSSSGVFSSVCASVFSGSTASPFDVENGNGASGAGTTTTGSVTPNQDNSLVVTVCETDAGSGHPNSINGGFTIGASAAQSGLRDGTGIAYLIQTTATAANPTWTITASGPRAATIDVFKPAGGAASGILVNSWMGGIAKRGAMTGGIRG